MTDKKKPNGPKAADPLNPPQQSGDDGENDAESFANIEPGSAANFANINPTKE